VGRPLSRHVVLLVLPTLVVVAAALALMSWRSPARVLADVTVSRLAFTVGGSEPVALVRAVPVRSVTVERFERVTLTPARFEAVDPPSRPGRPATPLAGPAHAPTPLIVTGAGDALQPSVTFEAAGDDGLGMFGPLWVRPGGGVTIEVRSASPRRLSMRFDGERSAATLSFPQSFQLLTRQVRLEGGTGVDPRSGVDTQSGSVTFAARLDASNPVIETIGQPRSFVVSLSIAPTAGPDVFPRPGIPITAIAFTEQGATGGPASALTTDGELSFPDYPAMARSPLKPPDVLVLAGLERFHVEAIAPVAQGIRVRASGVAREIRAGSGPSVRDLRPSRFDVLRQNRALVAVFSIAVWVVPTTIAGYRLYRELVGGS